MKLIQRTNRNFFIAGILVLPIAAIFLLIVLNYFFNSEIDEQLILDQTRIVNQLKSNKEPFSISPIIEINKIDQKKTESISISDVEVYDPLEKENEPFRELRSIKKIDEQWFEIKVRHSIIENEDVIFVVGITMFLMLLLIVLGLYFFNYWSSKKIWNPFYQNLEKVKRFSLENKESPVFVSSKINEFDDLKKSLTELTSKIQNDYNSLKEFTENASHEIQTPLTIISMNLEEMLQEDLSETNYSKLYSTLQSAQKLSKMNEKLLLLSKLENDQFQDSKEICVTTLLKNKIEELKPILEESKMQLDLDLNENFKTAIDPFLANLLITNILSNAIKHNNEKRNIRIVSSSSALIFQNSTDKTLEIDKIFDRFHKQSGDSNSVGLGLAIVKKIVDVSGLKLSCSLKSNVFEVIIKK